MDSEAQAARFVEGRKAAVGFADYPGSLPDSLDAAYAVQAAAIGLWPDRLVGWKVGRIGAPLSATLGEDRFLGPLFATSVLAAGSDFRAISNGFSAFESELVIIAAADSPADKTAWTADEARDLVGAIHIGIEVAGSPLASINDLGALASIAGFGNNVGLILGTEVARWPTRPFNSIRCVTTIDGVVVGDAVASAIPGGPLTAYAYALGKAARLGRPIRRGDLISTGAITGVHTVSIGQHCSADFGELGIVTCKVAQAAPASTR